MHRACKRAGIKEVQWHCLRHTFASHLVMAGVPLKAVQELLGHSTQAMTERYAHLTPDVRRDAVAVLDDTAWHTNGTTELEEKKVV
jgi:site-specific recombinase XerD